MDEVDKIEPKLDFNVIELKEYLDLWKDILCLNDWFISIRRVPLNECLVDGEKALGNCWFEYPLKCAEITLAILTKEEKRNEVVRYCIEKILIHELLHLKIGAERYSDSSSMPLEAVKFFADEHQLIEEMAISFICARYGVTRSWFLNDER